MDLFNVGAHRAPVAVFYLAEFEWVGEAIPVERPVRMLKEAQIDMDIVSFDHLKEVRIKNKNILITVIRSRLWFRLFYIFSECLIVAQYVNH